MTVRAKGPAVQAAFGADGEPTAAAIGFARGKGVDVGDLVRGADDGGEYVYAMVERHGLASAEVLPELLASPGVRHRVAEVAAVGRAARRAFIRPVRWLLALLGDRGRARVRFAGLTAGRADLRAPLPRAQGADRSARRDVVLRRARARQGRRSTPRQRARLIREGIETAAARSPAVAVVPERVVRRGGEPRRVPDRGGRTLRRERSCACLARCWRPPWSRTSATSRSRAPMAR